MFEIVQNAYNNAIVTGTDKYNAFYNAIVFHNSLT